MDCCLQKDNIKIIKEYDPQPKNKDGSIRWFLYRWDDGKNGVRRLVRCRCCSKLYLVQAYQLHKFSDQKDVLFEDWYAVENQSQADYWNRNYTGIQLERKMETAFHLKIKIEGEKYELEYLFH